MTILLPVDAAYAFDYLAILRVKWESGLDVEREFGRVSAFLAIQLDNFNEVFGSGEYHELVIRNRRTFEAIELAHLDEITARKVQEINYARYLAKKALQEKFWPDAPLSEQKTSLTKRR